MPHACAPLFLFCCWMVLLLQSTPWTSNTVKLINISKYYSIDKKAWILTFSSSLPIVWPCTLLIRFHFQRSKVNMAYLSLKINTTILTGTFCIFIFVSPQVISFFVSFVKIFHLQLFTSPDYYWDARCSHTCISFLELTKWQRVTHNSNQISLTVSNI